MEGLVRLTNNMQTFSKKFIFVLSVSFFVVLIWSMICITFSIGSVEYVNIPVDVLGLVMTSGTVGYLLKSAQENKEKIKKQSYMDDIEDYSYEEDMEDI